MYKQQLIKFLDSQISLSDLKDFIEDRLFELRQIPDMTEEQEVLSSLELIIHEFCEGMRSGIELQEHIRLAALPEMICTIDISPTTPSTIHTYSFSAPVTEYHSDKVAV